MNHRLSAADVAFRADFEAGAIPTAHFDHRAHLRLAYIYLTTSDTETAYRRMKDALLAYLDHHGVPRTKYHETITRAWILAVRHFMMRTLSSSSADAFIDRHPQMLDPKVMMSHYSQGVLFTDVARVTFIEPDLAPIPRYPDV